MNVVLYPFAWILRMLYALVQNYGVALILFSLAIKLILLPINMKSKKSMMKTTRLTPKLKALEAKYAGDQLKYQQEMTKLYKEEGVSPMGGCLWSLIPLIIMIMLYGIVRQPMTYLMGLSAEECTTVVEFLNAQGITYAGGGYAQVFYASYVHEFFNEIQGIVPGIIDINFNFLGLDISQIPDWRVIFSGVALSWANIGLFLIPIISGAMNFLTSKLANKLNGSVATDEKGQKMGDAAASMNSSMKMMMWMMPLMSIYIGFIMPAGISVYWTAQAVFNMVQEVWLTRRYRKIYDAEDADKAARAAEEEALEAERSRRREELKAGGEIKQNPNTSKRKRKNQERALMVPTVEGKLSEEEREELRRKQEEVAEQRRRAMAGEIPAERPYSRGRAYDPNRYGKNGEEIVGTEDQVVDDTPDMPDEN